MPGLVRCASSAINKAFSDDYFKYMMSFPGCSLYATLSPAPGATAPLALPHPSSYLMNTG